MEETKTATPDEKAAHAYKIGYETASAWYAGREQAIQNQGRYSELAILFAPLLLYMFFIMFFNKKFRRQHTENVVKSIELQTRTNELLEKLVQKMDAR
jgi:hypothetical protein